MCSTTSIERECYAINYLALKGCVILIVSKGARVILIVSKECVIPALPRPSKNFSRTSDFQISFSTNSSRSVGVRFSQVPDDTPFGWDRVS